MRRSVQILAVLLASALFASAAQAQTTLRYKFKEGDKLDYVVDQDGKISMNVLGMDLDMSTKMVMELSSVTLKVDEKGSAQGKVTLNKVKMTMEGGPFGKIEVDSTDDNEPDNPFAKIFYDMVKGARGLEMTFSVDPLGKLSDVKLSEGKKMKKLPGGGLGIGGGGAIGPDALKAMVEGYVYIPLPEKAVSKGDSWTQKMTTKTDLGKMTGENKYTYDGEEKGLHKFAVKPDMKVDTDPNAPVSIKLKNGSGKGVTLFDNKAGRIASANGEAKMEMEIEAMGQSIAVNSTQTTTLRVKTGKKSSKE